MGKAQTKGIESSVAAVPNASKGVLGDFHDFSKDLLGAIRSRYDQYGPLFSWRPFGRPSVVMLGASANKFALVSQPKVFLAGPAWQSRIGRLFEGGLLNLDGPRHQHYRKLLMPAFQNEAIKHYLQKAEPIIDSHLASWPGHSSQMKERLSKLIIDNALQVFFGFAPGEDDDFYQKRLAHLVKGSIALIRAPLIGNSYRRALKARNELSNRLMAVVKKRRDHPGLDMISRLCAAQDESGQMLSDEEVVRLVLFIMMAAHDTNASTGMSVLYELAKHPFWQDKLRNESLKQKALGYDFSEISEHLTGHHLVIKETLRLNTPLKVILRSVSEDISYEGVLLPKGSMVVLCPAFTHVMKDYWASPEAFSPLRFVNRDKLVPYSFLPFGAGLHSCLGQLFAEKFLSSLLYKINLKGHFRIQKLEKVTFSQVPIQTPKNPVTVVWS